MVAIQAVCNSAVCMTAAQAILANLSPKYKALDPCSDFEEYVCGGFKATHTIPADRTGLGTFDQVADRNREIQLSILEGSYPGASYHSAFSPRNLKRAAAASDQENFDKMKTLYDTCLDIDAVKRAGIAPLLDVLADFNATFPIDDASFASPALLGRSDWPALQKAHLWMQRVGIDTFVGIGPTSDDKKPDELIIYAGPISRYGLPSRSNYEQNAVVNEYQEVMARVLRSVMPSKAARDNAAKLAAGVVAFERAVVRLAPDPDSAGDVTKYYNIMSLNETAALVPEIGLEYVLKELIPANYTIDRMLTTFPSLIKRLSPILANTTKQTMQAFFVWQTTVAFSGGIEADELKPYKQFLNRLAGRDPDSVTPRFRTCISHVSSNLGWVLSRFFVERAFSQEAKALGDQIVSDIKKSFIEKLKSVTWMDDEVKVLGIQKVNNIVQKIGYPTTSPNIMDPESLASWYAPFNVTTSYFGNIRNSNDFKVRRGWAKLGKPVDKGEWSMTVPTVNAYYNPSNNEIVFPAGIMQFPFFTAGLPSYVNYGAFGSVAGHELTHAFDDSGRNFDMNGVFADWWTKRTVAEFEKRANCFVQQFSNYTVQGPGNRTSVRVNGRLTLGENIADSGGVSGAFQSYRTSVAAGGAEPGLPGLSDFFTNDQLFFISYANVWCGIDRPESLVAQVRSDVHSPAHIRILGTMANSRGFREAFSCPVKEPTCELW